MFNSRKKLRKQSHFLRLCLCVFILAWVCVAFQLFHLNSLADASQIWKSSAKQVSRLLGEKIGKCSNYPRCKSIKNLPTSLNGDCLFDVTENTEYLPDSELIECLQNNPDTIWKRDLKEFKDRVTKLQNPERCDHPDSTFPDNAWHTVKFTSHGHGVNFFIMACLIGNHWDRGIPVMPSKSAYRFGSHKEICDGKTQVFPGWSCHFSPLSRTCDFDDPVTQRAIKNINQLRFPGKLLKDWCQPHGIYQPKYGRCKCEIGYFPGEDGTSCLNFANDPHFADQKKWKPRYKKHHSNDDYTMTATEHWISRMAPGEVFSHQNHQDPAHWSYLRFISHFPHAVNEVSRLKLKYGFFWWMLKQMWLLHENSPKRSLMERKVLDLIGRENECIAVQVRRGDSCNDPTAPHRTCLKLQVYADYVEKIKKKYYNENQGRKLVIFLATDDPSAIQEAKELKTEDTWVWQNIDRVRYVNGKVVDNNPALFSDEAVDELYFDLWAISYCRLGFITSFASSVAWNAYALAVGRYGYYIPFISVDWPWGHKILGGHHASGNLFDGTIDPQELLHRMDLFED